MSDVQMNENAMAQALDSVVQSRLKEAAAYLVEQVKAATPVGVDSKHPGKMRSAVYAVTDGKQVKVIIGEFYSAFLEYSYRHIDKYGKKPRMRDWLAKGGKVSQVNKPFARQAVADAMDGVHAIMSGDQPEHL